MLLPACIHNRVAPLAQQLKSGWHWLRFRVVTKRWKLMTPMFFCKVLVLRGKPFCWKPSKGFLEPW
jgi:hypothetical protein